MYTIGIDLAIQGEHTASVVNEAGEFVTPLLRFRARADDMDRLLVAARAGDPACELQAVMEPTGMAWLPVAVYLSRRGVRVYLVNGQQVHDLRRFYKRHAKSDRIDARVLAKLPLVNAEQLHGLTLASAPGLACQRACKQRDRLVTQSTALQNRLLALDRFAWPGLESIFKAHFSPAARWFRAHWYNPQRVCQAGADLIRQQWCQSQLATDDDGAWAAAVVSLAAQIVAVYGPEGHYVDFDLLQREVICEQEQLAFVEALETTLRVQTLRPLYRQLHPSRHLETLKGVGQEGAAVYVSFIGDPQRFASNRAYRGWSGMVPDSNQSADSEAKGLHISQAGPDLIKKFAYLDADVARHYDPQIAAIYYDQMVHKGKHHQQALCTCATHLLDRVLAVLREDKPYELRDVDGAPVTAEQARQIVLERYTVPAAVRARSTKTAQQVRHDRRAEKKMKRESHPS
jgi:transposase